MKMISVVVAAGLVLGGSAYAGEILSSVPTSSKTVSEWYKQDVYDRSNSKIGKIDDVLVTDSGQINALIVGVGGFLGAGEKDVAVPFSAVRRTTKNNKTYLTMDASKDQLKSAHGLKYDSNEGAWVSDKG